MQPFQSQGCCERDHFAGKVAAALGRKAQGEERDFSSQTDGTSLTFSLSLSLSFFGSSGIQTWKNRSEKREGKREDMVDDDIWVGDCQN